LLAGSQLRIWDHQLGRCAHQVDDETGLFRLPAGFGPPGGLELGDLHEVELPIEAADRDPVEAILGSATENVLVAPRGAS